MPEHATRTEPIGRDPQHERPDPAAGHAAGLTWRWGRGAPRHSRHVPPTRGGRGRWRVSRRTSRPGCGRSQGPRRQAFEARDLPDDLVAQLVADAAHEGVALHLVGGEARPAVAGLIAEGDRIQMADERFRRELAAWVHPNRSPSGDGMRGYGFGFGDLASHAGPLMIRSFDLGRGQAAKDRALAVGSPLLAVLATAADDPAAWLATGQALQRVLLRARAAGAWSSYLNQPVEVPRLRTRLAEAIGRPGEWPQLVVRLGYGPPVEPEPRRPVDDVLLAEGGSRSGTSASR